MHRSRTIYRYGVNLMWPRLRSATNLREARHNACSCSDLIHQVYRVMAHVLTSRPARSITVEFVNPPLQNGMQDSCTCATCEDDVYDFALSSLSVYLVQRSEPANLKTAVASYRTPQLQSTDWWPVPLVPTHVQDKINGKVAPHHLG